MSRKNYKVYEVIRSLSHKNDVKITEDNNGWRTVYCLSDKIRTKKGQIIDNPEKSHDLGNGSHGKIDFLVKHCGFRKQNVSSFK